MTPDWISKKGIYTPEEPIILERARKFRLWLKQREETEIVGESTFCLVLFNTSSALVLIRFEIDGLALVVAHGEILKMITDGVRSERVSPTFFAQGCDSARCMTLIPSDLTTNLAMGKCGSAGLHIPRGRR